MNLPAPPTVPRRRRLEGCLLGTAVGDALGLPYEGLSARRVRRRWRAARYTLVGPWGFVSDDTEQSALVAQALCGTQTASGVDVERVVQRFRWSLLGWFARLPFGIGLATVRACLKILVGIQHSGVRSAGNGAAMRSMIVGAAFADRTTRVAVATALARVTHVDERAIAAAVFVADVAAGEPDPVGFVQEPELHARLLQASALAQQGGDDDEIVQQAARALGTSGFVIESVPFAWFCFKRFGPTFAAVTAAISGGGDVDTNAAIVGGWVGALAPHEIPEPLVNALVGGPFGPRHLRALALAVDDNAPAPGYVATVALLRNLLLYPVILAHGFRRLLPPW
jgi:ADP-ribosyl-[dinitrogen reductase] hydrolase